MFLLISFRGKFSVNQIEEQILTIHIPYRHPHANRRKPIFSMEKKLNCYCVNTICSIRKFENEIVNKGVCK